MTTGCHNWTLATPKVWHPFCSPNIWRQKLALSTTDKHIEVWHARDASKRKQWLERVWHTRLMVRQVWDINQTGPLSGTSTSIFGSKWMVSSQTQSMHKPTLLIMPQPDRKSLPERIQVTSSSDKECRCWSRPFRMITKIKQEESRALSKELSALTTVEYHNLYLDR